MTGTVGSFEFATATRIIFGAGTVADLPGVVAALGSRVLACTGRNAERHELFESLKLPVEIVAVHGEPTVQAVREAVERCTAFGADVVLAVGGGSVMDLGKAVAMLRGNGGDPLDYLEVIGRGTPIRRPSVPLIAVPTTAGSGAEVTANAVLSSPEHERKASLRARSMLPSVALVDPLLTLSCGSAVTAASGLDALTQCLEPFVSPFATPLTDLFAVEGIRLAAGALRTLHLLPDDVPARTDMALASLLGGLALANAKLGAVHGLAGVIGGQLPVAHGAICAALLAPVSEVNVRVLKDRAPESDALRRYATAARLLTGSATATVDDGLAWMRETVAMLGIPGLTGLGLPTTDTERLHSIATMAATSSSMRGNPVPLTSAELHECLVGS